MIDQVRRSLGEVGWWNARHVLIVEFKGAVFTAPFFMPVSPCVGN
jgi:hypothetical protein